MKPITRSIIRKLEKPSHLYFLESESGRESVFNTFLREGRIRYALKTGMEHYVR